MAWHSRATGRSEVPAVTTRVRAARCAVGRHTTTESSPRTRSAPVAGPVTVRSPPGCSVTTCSTCWGSARVRMTGPSPWASSSPTMAEHWAPDLPWP